MFCHVAALGTATEWTACPVAPVVPAVGLYRIMYPGFAQCDSMLPFQGRHHAPMVPRDARLLDSDQAAPYSKGCCGCSWLRLPIIPQQHIRAYVDTCRSLESDLGLKPATAQAPCRDKTNCTICAFASRTIALLKTPMACGIRIVSRLAP